MSSGKNFSPGSHTTIEHEKTKKVRKQTKLRARKKIYPGQDGAKKYHDEYGDRLYCVRYRYDKAGRRRYTTVEIIVDKRPLNSRDSLDVPFAIAVDYEERELRTKLRQGGAYWDAKKKCYFATLWLIRDLGIVDRIIYPDAQ